jgi:pimeloyl-ACP methyl ester carboxylesterase
MKIISARQPNYPIMMQPDLFRDGITRIIKGEIAMNWITVSIVTAYAIAAFLIVPLLAIGSEAGHYKKKEAQIHNGPIILSGTLTLPKSAAPYPCVVVQVAASQPGMLDAADDFFPKYLNQMANGLARGGIATLQYDMRGADLSHKEYLEFTLEDFANDALAAVQFLGKRSEIDSNRIGLCGLSEGAWTVALAASRSKDVDFLILLESPSFPVEEADEAMARARGTTEEEIQEMHRGLKQVYQASRSGKVDAELEAGIRKQATETLKNLPEKQRPPLDSFVQAQIDRILSRNFRYLLDFQPKEVFRKIKCPTLALFGELGLMVPAGGQPETMKAAFEAGGNMAFTMQMIPRASHIFTDAKAGPQEIIPSKIVFAPGFPDVIVDWILQRK